MARKKLGEDKRNRAKTIEAAVDSYEFTETQFKRKMIPEAAKAEFDKSDFPKKKYIHAKLPTKTFAYDPHLPPNLIWAGKEEEPNFEVPTVSLHVHEVVDTKEILKAASRKDAQKLMGEWTGELALPASEKIAYYKHDVNWKNRLILGDSLLVMNSLSEAENLKGKIQCIYVDPPYGIAYNSNFQPTTASRDVKDKSDDALTREVEQIQAYRDTWKHGLHSYLSYLRDRLLIARDLLHESGSIFVQISDDNLHHVRELMDEVFGPENFCSIITFAKTSAQTSEVIPAVTDYLLWYCRNREKVKLRPIFSPKKLGEEASQYCWINEGKNVKRVSPEDAKAAYEKGKKIFRLDQVTSQTGSENSRFEYSFEGKKFVPQGNRGWSTNLEGLNRLKEKSRLMAPAGILCYVRYFDDFPVSPITNLWEDTGSGGFLGEKTYVVQTTPKTIQRCILMTTDPGDLVLDPTCGSGTAAFVAEHWGRRWITIDTSRIALMLARQRILTAKYPYYKLKDTTGEKVSEGFIYETVPHITLRSVAQNLPPDEEVLFDKPDEDNAKVRVSGPFTVESISQYEIRDSLKEVDENGASFLQVLVENIRRGGLRLQDGRKIEIEDLQPLDSSQVHAEGILKEGNEHKRLAFSFGPKYGPVTVTQVQGALAECRGEQFKVLVVVGFSFEDEAIAFLQKNPVKWLDVRFGRLSPDLLIGDLLKTTKQTAVVTLFGEPDVAITKKGDEYVVEVKGFDFYDPLKDELVSGDTNEVAAWFLDQDYDSEGAFVITQAFFTQEKDAWERLSRALGKLNVINAEALEKLKGFKSLPFKVGRHKKIAVKLVDHRGNEAVRIVELK